MWHSVKEVSIKDPLNDAMSVFWTILYIVIFTKWK